GDQAQRLYNWGNRVSRTPSDRAVARTRARGSRAHPCGVTSKATHGMYSNHRGRAHSTTYAHHIQPADTFVQLVGVSHPNPSKAAQFRAVDLKSATGAILAARGAGIQHFIYLSVAQPAPVMKAYIQVRAECECQLRDSGMNATILRPWYVLGPGHRWPYALISLYRILEMLPGTRKGALRLGLVTRDQMAQALVRSVENPSRGVRLVEVPEIRSGQAFSAHWDHAANA